MPMLSPSTLQASDSPNDALSSDCQPPSPQRQPEVTASFSASNGSMNGAADAMVSSRSTPHSMSPAPQSAAPFDAPEDASTPLSANPAPVIDSVDAGVAMASMEEVAPTPPPSMEPVVDAEPVPMMDTSSLGSLLTMVPTFVLF